MTIDADETRVDSTPRTYESEAEMRSGISRTWSWFSEDPVARVPWATAPFVWTAAEIMSFCHVNWMGPGLVTFAAACVAYGKASRKAARSEFLELDGPELAAVYGLPGAWLTLATKFGPLPFIGPPVHDTLTFIFALMYGFGPIWLRRHEATIDRRNRKLLAAQEAAERRAAEEAWEAKCEEWRKLAPKIGLGGSFLLKAEENENDSETWTIDLYGAGTLASSVNCRHAQEVLSGQKTDVLGGWLVPRDRVEVRPHPQYAYYLLITFYRSERWSAGADQGTLLHPMFTGELDTENRYAPLFPPRPSIFDPIAIGADPETGEPMLLYLFDEAEGAHRILVLARSGGGKSMVLDTLRERITACEDAVLILVNLAKGTEDKWWEPLPAASALGGTGNLDQATHDRALKILDFVHDVVMGGRPRTRGRRTHKPTPGEPVIVLMIDEVDATANDEERKRQLGEIASKCRSEGIVLIIGSQRPQDMYVGGGMVRSNLTDIVWGVLRGNDLRQASGGLADLPDMNDYGQGNPGVFGIAALPMREGAPVQRGRAFFWGAPESPGLIKIVDERIAAAGGQRPYQTLEPGLAPYAPLWAEISGSATEADKAAIAQQLATRGDADRYSKVHTRAGDVPSGAARVGRLDEMGDTLTKLFQQKECGPAPAAPAAPQIAPAAPPVPAAPQTAQSSIGTGVMPPADEAKLWGLVCTTQGGITTRRVENGGPMKRVNPPPGGPFEWSPETIRKQLNAWEAVHKVRRAGSSAETSWLPSHLQPVPDLPAEPQTAVSAPAEPTEREGFTEHETVMIAAGWVIGEPDETRARAFLAERGMDAVIINQVLNLLRHDRGYVAAELRRLTAPALRPGQRMDEGDEPDEQLDGSGEDEDEDAAP